MNSFTFHHWPFLLQSSFLQQIRFLCSMISLIFVFVFGGFLTEIVVDLSKVCVGELRPSFLAVCQANASQADCQQGYVTKDVCAGDPYDVKMARLEYCGCYLFFRLFVCLLSQSPNVDNRTVRTSEKKCNRDKSEKTHK